jgi:hypothetical protein
VQRLDQVRQIDTRVVQEAVGAEDGGEASGQLGQGQGVDAGGERVAGV